MLRRIRHSLMCFPRRRCDCDSDSDSSGAQPNRPREIAPKRALRQSLPKNVVRGAAPANQPQASSEYEDGSEDEDSSDDYYPPAPPPSEVPLYNEVSHTGITPAMSETNLDDDSSSNDPYSRPSRNTRTHEVSNTDPKDASSSGDLHSLATRNSRTGITPEMSDASIGESQYKSFPESGESSLFVSAGEYNTDEDDYNGADEDSLDLNQYDDEEMHDDLGEPETSDHLSQSWPTNSSDRRRRRSLDSQARADAEHKGLYGSRGSSGRSKRQRLEGSSDTASGRVRTGIEPTVKDVTRYRNIGARYQAWIDNPEAPGCRIQRATLTIEEMINEAQPMPWKIDESCFTVEPMALEGGDVESMNIARGGPRYRYTHLRRDPGPNALAANEFEHRIARGVLVAERIFREDGPHWNEVARAQYLLDFNLKTLRHVIFTDISNEETAPYIRHELYPRFGATWSQSSKVGCMVFEHGSAEYQELLGTKLGKSVACLILSSFPRGTMKITRIVTWCNSTAPQMRFEIEPVIAAPIAFATAA
ncbi:hypothetical protein PEX1_083010 [Penicillium expansum]|uniref:Uncharacterized protein n=1 Tax=Penicillium expansum TaxID=27334 RepID=A0A0A2IK66_PENEN|nr:hypothetical protein PEX2_082450 [Penicillium expansum]KGO43502.1 hypothetical protein PEXP_094030 [Penicillium expansum]KGO52598.1 hypothetical protein PEX2_082450 [Penicillium expansum]KGO52982.1 hypothetical protein PEX1_083010 [Penicillium expansum]